LRDRTRARARFSQARRVCGGWTLALAITSFGCAGAIGDASGDGGPMSPSRPSRCAPDSVEAQSIGPSPLRRLTHYEYNNTVRDLLGDTTQPANEFAPENREGVLDNDVGSLSISPTLFEQYYRAADAIAARALEGDGLARVAGCAPTGAMEMSCVRQFIEALGSRAYRRPLSGEEVASLTASYTSARMGADPRTGFRTVLAQMLLSPNFLYRVEVGSSVAGRADRRRLTPYELASRLSYGLWGTMPDAALFEAARVGALGTIEQLRAQVRRMTRGANGEPVEKARVHLAHVFSEWLGLDAVRRLTKDRAAFPMWNDELRDSMLSETQRFLQELSWQRGTIANLFDARHSFVDARLAALYGASTPSGSGLQRVEFDPMQRFGLLTHGSLLARNSGAGQTSPIRRGQYVRERILCSPLPSPPSSVDNTPPMPNPMLTTRQRFARHTADPSCRSCHEQIDPVGFGFENYDAIGRFRREENGMAIDSSGSLIATDVDGTFASGREMLGRLAASQQARACVIRQFFRYAHGRYESEADRCVIDELESRVDASGGRIEELFTESLLTSDALYRSATP
jgi:hypothetical protein